MVVQIHNRELYQIWAMRLAIVTTIIVVLLSFINELRFFDLMLRAGISFGVMYVLLNGILNLFERSAPRKADNSLPDSADVRGGNIDVSVGDDELLAPQGSKAEFPGQIDRDLSSGLPDSERQAEIVRRMGWNN